LSGGQGSRLAIASSEEKIVRCPALLLLLLTKTWQGRPLPRRVLFRPFRVFKFQEI